ncbi:MAG: hypothetical protein AAFV29_19190, partial [Myxococcota bacterium]
MVLLRDESVQPNIPLSDVRTENPWEKIARQEASLDILIAQLAHTDTDNPRWLHLRNSLQAQSRLLTGLSALPDPDGDLDAQRVTQCALRWLRQLEPALTLLAEDIDLGPDNELLFASLRERAETRREQLYATRSRSGVDRVRRVKPAFGTELVAPTGDGAWNDHISAMLSDAEAWCAARGGRYTAVLGLARIAEAALLARHISPALDVTALFERYLGAPQIGMLHRFRPENILALDAVFGQGSAVNAASLRLTEQQLTPEVVSVVRPFFEARAGLARQHSLRLPHRAFDALYIRLGPSRMRLTTTDLNAPLLRAGLQQLGADAFASAIVQAGPAALASLLSEIEGGKRILSVLTAFEPLGHGLGTVLKSIPPVRLVEMIETMGAQEIQRQLYALGADGLKHLVDCVGLSGSLLILFA